MNTIKEQLDLVGKKILTYSRNQIYLSMRFMDIALSALGFEMNLSTRTFGTDGLKLFYNPRHLIDLYAENEILVNRGYMHMLIHGIFGHCCNRGARNKEYWDLACDIAAASVLYSIQAKCVAATPTDFIQSVFDDLKRQMGVLSAEAIYRNIYNRQISPSQLDLLKKTFAVDDHSFWQDKDQDENEQQRRQQAEKNWKDISEKIQTGMETLAKEYGEDAGNLLYNLKIYNRERYDLRAFLQKFTVLREEVKTDPEQFDYIYYTYGLEHYGDMPLIEPLEYKESKKIQDFVIVIDTSESCDQELVLKFLEIVYEILSEQDAFFDRVRIHLLQCDIEIKQDIKITSLDEFKNYIDCFTVLGGGGTDFRPAFVYVNQLIENGELSQLKGMIYFTDGYGQFPRVVPAYDSVFVFLDETGEDIKVPAWAMKLILNKEELTPRRS